MLRADIVRVLAAIVAAGFISAACSDNRLSPTTSAASPAVRSGADMLIAEHLDLIRESGSD